jgi:hypothetical protein
VAQSPVFIGKRLYHYYVKSKIPARQLNRMLKLNDRIQKSSAAEAAHEKIA